MTTHKRYPKQQRIVFIPDLQVPEQDDRAIELFCEIVRNYVKPTRAIYLGDMINFDAISKHSKIEPDVSIEDEIDEFHRVIDRIGDALGKSCFKQAIEGNHEERWPKKLFDKVPELASLPHFSLENALDLESHEINGFHRRIELAGGKFVALHGHPYCGQVPGSVARKWIEREGRSGINGHIHRLCMIPKTLHDRTLRWWEGGSLCANPQRYLKGQRADWQLGFVWGLFTDQDFQCWSVDFHDNYSWRSPDGREWRV